MYVNNDIMHTIKACNDINAIREIFENILFFLFEAFDFNEAGEHTRRQIWFVLFRYILLHILKIRNR